MRLTLLIATHNRAEVLRQTLEAMCTVDRKGLDLQLVIIDNNSKDHTSRIIESFETRLPILHLYEPKPGKSAALNLALNTVPLGDVAVFTDDDVAPREDWLKRIATVCEERPDCSVFGGRVTLLWPEGVDIPAWAHFESMQFVFSRHDLGSETCAYPKEKLPTGANFWLRRTLCNNHRFDESLGPGDALRAGEETRLLRDLRLGGFEPLYVGGACVGHRVSKQQLAENEALRRARQHARGLAYRQVAGAERNPGGAFELVIRAASVLRHWLRYLAVSSPLLGRDIIRRTKAAWALAYNVELLHQAWRAQRGRK